MQRLSSLETSIGVVGFILFGESLRQGKMGLAWFASVLLVVGVTYYCVREYIIVPHYRKSGFLPPRGQAQDEDIRRLMSSGKVNLALRAFREANPKNGDPLTAVYKLIGEEASATPHIRPGYLKAFGYTVAALVISIFVITLYN